MSIASWLKEEVTIEEFEREYALELAKHPSFARSWRSLLTRMKPGDSLRMWKNPPKWWKRGLGWGGIAIVRNGKVVDFLGTVRGWN
ncbi:hypothetical protein I41_37170 [Lacipirellula limnantheis]|uniref:Uncharacterized protein n=1 Tax=Lacipirellula limnantheis TaxID=2528024 RepID=A0A517U1M7_9BACT|nr:hypothetical protein I41_37170 [Lacipirellula limnantheis]